MAIGDLVINDDKRIIGCVISKHTSTPTWTVLWTMSDRFVTTFHYTEEIHQMRKRLKRYMDKANVESIQKEKEGTTTKSG